MKIRKATNKDLDILTHFWFEEEKSNKRFHKHMKLRKNARELIYNFLRESFNKHDYICLIAEDNMDILGVIQGHIAKGYFLYDTDKFGHLATIFVKEEYRRKGIAKKLIERMMKWFKSKNIETVDLYVYSQNKDALKTWKRLNFRETMKLMVKKV